MTDYDFEIAWLSIYRMMEDNAFDYRGEPLFLNDSAVVIDGTTYYATPF